MSSWHNSKVSKRGGATIGGGATIRGNTVFYSPMFVKTNILLSNWWSQTMGLVPK